jgi:RES domain-containing protein
MLIYRITTEKWATSLAGSGIAARWNSQGIPILYTTSNRSLACLENLVHRRSLGSDAAFRLVTLSIPPSVKGITINPVQLPPNWNQVTDKAWNVCRAIGDDWFHNSRSLYLKVPSAIIPEEENILINPNHSAIKKVKVVKVERFVFDGRI